MIGRSAASDNRVFASVRHDDVLPSKRGTDDPGVLRTSIEPARDGGLTEAASRIDSSHPRFIAGPPRPSRIDTHAE